jgi:hypothetical protein
MRIVPIFKPPSGGDAEHRATLGQCLGRQLAEQAVTVMLTATIMQDQVQAIGLRSNDGVGPQPEGPLWVLVVL